jgi:DNA-binding NarL/FixJ family response regulator
MIGVWNVEDDDLVRLAVTRKINRSEDMRCEKSFTCCEDLLAELEKPGPFPDVILLDIQLPGLSGLEAIGAVKAKSPQSQILMLTLHADEDRIFRALCSGASGYLVKTSNDNIPAAIREAVNGGVPFSPAVARSVLSIFSRMEQPAKEAVDYQLTLKEKSVLEFMVEGLIKKQIADRLQISYFTVDGCMRRIYEKLHVNNAPSAVAKAIRERLC